MRNWDMQTHDMYTVHVYKFSMRKKLYTGSLGFELT